MNFSVVGDIFIDILASGLPHLPDQWNSDTNVKSIEISLGGSATNVATVLATLGGGKTQLFSVVGDDNMANISFNLINKKIIRNIETLSNISTPTCVIMAGPKDRSYLSCYGSLLEFSPHHINKEKILLSQHIHFTAYYCLGPNMKGDEFLEFVKFLKESGKTISLDTQLDSQNKYEGNVHQLLPLIDYFLPSESEAKGITKSDTVEESLTILCDTYPSSLIVIKCGELGSIAGKGKERWKQDALTVNIIDTVGAGDSYIGGFLLGHLERGYDIPTSLRYATSVATLSLTKKGAPANYEWKESEVINF
jgi:sugar/nucleoside kinase (ribokinase family)